MTRLIIDTDMGCDCDDAGALAIAHTLCKLEEANLLAVTHCCDGLIPCQAIDAINRYYNNVVPVGGFFDKTGVYEGYKRGYTCQLAEEFHSDIRPQNGVALLRKTLWEQPDNSVTLVVIGSLYTMHLLQNSKPDNICPLEGKSLVGSKIAKTVVMGGRFKQYWPQPYRLNDGYLVESEFNIRANISAAIDVCNNWCGELYFVSYELGFHIKTGGDLLVKGALQNPVRRAYQIFCNEARESWDLIAVLYAIRSDQGLWTPSKHGKVSVSSDGVTTMKEEKHGHHHLLTQTAPDNEIINLLDTLLGQQP